MKESKRLELVTLIAIGIIIFMSLLAMANAINESNNRISLLEERLEEVQQLDQKVSEIDERLNDILVEPDPEPEEEQPVEEKTVTAVPTKLVQTNAIESTPISDVDLISVLVMAEAEGEPELGKRLVIDTVLNRVDHPAFPNTIHDVIYQSGQFTSMTNGRSDRCYVKDDIKQLVLEELQNRTNSEVAFFRTQRYSDYGTPLFVECCHYFSKY